MNKEIKQISILGCGWLGKLVADVFTKEKIRVLGSYRDAKHKKELIDLGIEPCFINVQKDGIESDDSDFFNSDALIIALPPGSVDDVEQTYSNWMRQILACIHLGTVRHVSFISSTSVYAETGGVVSENSEWLVNNAKASAILNAEQIFLDDKRLQTNILRVGGLIGVGRYPGSFTKKGTFRNRGNVPVNLVYGIDVARAIRYLLRNTIWNETFNVVCPEHPMRMELYSKAAELQGIDFSGMDDLNLKSNYKIVSADKLLKTGFQFRYANPMEGLPDLYENYLSQIII